MFRKLPTESIDSLILVRDKRIHISVLMLLRIVDHINLVNNDGGATIGEVLGFYKEHRRQQNSKRLVDYTYGGIQQMLKKMYGQKLLYLERRGKNIYYRLSKQGITILDNMYL